MDNNEEKILRDTPLTEEDTSIEAADRGPEPEADTAGPEPEGPSAVKEPEDSNMAADPDAEEPSAMEEPSAAEEPEAEAGPVSEEPEAEAGPVSEKPEAEAGPESEEPAAEAEPETEEPAAAGPDPEDAAPVDGPAEQAEETVTAPAGETGSAGRSFSGMLDDADSAASAGSAEDAPGQEDGEQNKPRKKHRIWIPILLILLLIGAAAGGYMYGVFYFRDRFIYNTKINGVVCGRLTPAETAERIGFRMEKYQMEITFRDNQKQTIKAAQIDYKFAPGDSIEKLLTKQDPYKWPLGIFQPVEYNVEEKTEYNHERATKLIEGFDQMKEENMVKPENAYMVLKDEGFSIVPEVEGNAVNTEPVTAAILAALDEDAASVNVEEIEGAYKEPSIRADNKELNEETDKLNGYIGADITYIVPEGDEEMRLNAKTLQTWLSVDDDGHYYKDEEVWADHIWNYVDQIAINVNTVADTRSFPATGIGTISVGGGDYGYSVNKSAERELLAQQLEDCETVTREPEYFTREFGPENDGLSDSYIEVDISRQHVWIYRDGSCVLDTDCVTGMLSGTRATPTGIYQILYKATDVDLKGQQLADGKYSYVSHVNYWMPFYNSCGFHDASWRSNFGGSIYINNGSHGCVNLPSWVAADFYSCVEEGMPVIIYYS